MTDLLAAQLAALRQDFDRSFAEPHRAAAEAGDDLLAIRIAAQPYAIRLSQIAGVFAGHAVTPLLGSDSRLLGLGGFRGTLVPVYDLHALLGHPRAESPHWQAMANGMEVAFAFAELEGFARVMPGEIIGRQPNPGALRHVGEFVSAAGIMRAIIDLPALLDDLRGTVDTARKKG